MKTGEDNVAFFGSFSPTQNTRKAKMVITAVLATEQGAVGCGKCAQRYTFRASSLVILLSLVVSHKRGDWWTFDLWPEERVYIFVPKFGALPLWAGQRRLRCGHPTPQFDTSNQPTGLLPRGTFYAAVPTEQKYACVAYFSSTNGVDRSHWMGS